MERISHRELRNQSSSVLRRVAAGESFEITNHGVVTALLTPAAGDTAYQRLIEAGRIAPAHDDVDLRTLLRSETADASRDIVDDVRGRW